MSHVKRKGTSKSAADREEHHAGFTLWSLQRLLMILFTQISGMESLGKYTNPEKYWGEMYGQFSKLA